MEKISLVITSISEPNKVLKQYSSECKKHNVDFILIGDTKSPKNFKLDNCNYYSIEEQRKLNFNLSKVLPEKHYARKNIGYLVAIQNNSDIIIETDDDNIPYDNFWDFKELKSKGYIIENSGWVNVYKYFSEENIWPRGFPLNHILKKIEKLKKENTLKCPIQQGLADDNPDVDAIYRLILPLPIKFKEHENIILKDNTWCPFNSQNTTWFKEAHPLLYLPYYCSFRMTDIWRSFVAQRIAWTLDWGILFHKANIYQERNEHNIMQDFKEEIDGYINNEVICKKLEDLELKNGPKYIYDNLIRCYQELISLNFVEKEELTLIDAWIKDIENLRQ